MTSVDTNSSLVSKKVDKPPLSTLFIRTVVTVGIDDSKGAKNVFVRSCSLNFLNRPSFYPL